MYRYRLNIAYIAFNYKTTIIQHILNMHNHLKHSLYI